ncbi:hypothetical protein D3C78_769870 [compost metagenome]
MEQLKKSPTTQLHIGAEHCSLVARRATAVAYHTGRRYTPTSFVRELIDRYSAQLEAELLSEAGHSAPAERPPGE